MVQGADGGDGQLFVDPAGLLGIGSLAGQAVPVHVGIGAARDQDAGAAAAAGHIGRRRFQPQRVALADEGLGKEPGQRRLADLRRADQQIGVGGVAAP